MHVCVLSLALFRSSGSWRRLIGAVSTAVVLQAWLPVHSADFSGADTDRGLPSGSHSGRLLVRIPALTPARHQSARRVEALASTQVADRARASSQTARPWSRDRTFRDRFPHARRMGRLDVGDQPDFVPASITPSLGLGRSILVVRKLGRRRRRWTRSPSPRSKRALVVSASQLARVAAPRPRRILGHDHLVRDRRVADPSRQSSPDSHAHSAD